MFKAQKALHLYQELDKKRTKIAEDTYAVFTKFDGWYAHKSTEIDSNIMSRANRAIPSLIDLSVRMGESEDKNSIQCVLPQGTLIFEVLVKGYPVFTDLNGILNRSKGDCTARGAYIKVHDYVVTGQESMPFLERYKRACRYVEMVNMPEVQIAKIHRTGSHAEVQYVAEQVWAKGGEGAIGKRIDAPYSMGKRNKDIIKVKCEVNLEMKVVGLAEGEGKYEGTTGKLIVQQADGTRHGVSGMSDDERDAWWDNPKLIKGKVVEIQAMAVLENGSLREGRFKAVRHDKTIDEID